MRLSSLVSTRFSLAGESVWLWHSLRKCDLACVRAEGLIWRPYVWLASTRKTAIGFHPSPDRIIVRVNASHLVSSLLHQDTAWLQWVGSLRRAGSTLPPSDLVQYWARLRKYEDPESAQRLKACVNGKIDSQQIRQDLRTQIARVRPDQLWKYEGAILPYCLSIANEAGFYVSLKTQTPLEEKEDVV